VVLVLLLSPLFDIALKNAVTLTFFMVFVVVFPWLIGRYRYQNAELMTSGWQRAEQLEREQRAVADQARLRERTRIAEDMHDSLGHELSLIALRSAALEVDRELPERHQEAAGQLRRSAATATERLREIIGLLRDETEHASVTPVDEGIGDLVDRARASGMDVACTVDPEAPLLPRMADRAAYRVVQESLTNAAKHAPGRAVTILVAATDDHSTISVSNDLPDPEQTGGISGGRGLVGLTERVRLAGGTLHSGPRNGRFEVVARLPHSTADAVTEEPVADTESVRQHVHVRTQARRRLLVAFALPAVMLVMLGIGTITVYYVVETGSVMPSRDYARLHEGQSRDSANEILPSFQMMDPPADLGITELPGGTECEYYSARYDSGPYSDVYQVCFADEVLTAKTVITGEERRRQDEDRYG
ncbi:MAG: sensor histidine kinase, partial [Stackebrandtia sp.]